MTQGLPLPLLTDEYELAMADSYLAQGMAGMTAAFFELSVRRLPPQRGYLIAAGLERVVDYLTRLRFDAGSLEHLRRNRIVSDALIDHLRELRFRGSLDAVAEGVAVSGQGQIALGLSRDRPAGPERGGRPGRPDRRRHARRPAELDQRRRLVRARRRLRQGIRDQEARLRHRGGRPRRRLGRRQRRRPDRPAHPQGLVRGPGRPDARDLDLAPRVEPRRDRHPDPRPRRRRRRPGRRRLRHGPRLRPLLAQAGQGHRRRADLDQARDRRHASPRSTPCSGPTSTATARPTSSSPASASTPTRSSRARPTARSSPGTSSTAGRRPGPSTSSSRASRPRTPPQRGDERDALKDFPPGTAGTGLQMTAIDIDGDGDLDLVCPGKSGLYLFENLG